MQAKDAVKMLTNGRKCVKLHTTNTQDKVNDESDVK